MSDTTLKGKKVAIIAADMVEEVELVDGSRRVACAIAPITDQTNGLSPCRSVHGW
jgi:hypothetical protein